MRLADTDNAIAAHNFFGRVSEELAVSKVATDRSLSGRKLTSVGNQIVNNIVVDQGKPPFFEDASNNIADYNVDVSTKAGQAARKDSGEHSVAISGDVTFDENRLELSWKSALPPPTTPLVKNCELD